MKTKQELAATVADAVGITRKDAAHVVDVVFSSVASDLANTGKADLPGLGKLSLQQRQARTGRNPRTGEEVDIPAKTAVKFTPGKAIKDAVN